jgi:hypothetical protein
MLKKLWPSYNQNRGTSIKYLHVAWYLFTNNKIK